MNYSLSSLWIVVILALVCCQTCSGKKNRDAPHIHRGVLSSYEPGPLDSIKLDSKDEKVLNSGKPIMKQTQGEGEEIGGTSICVQDVDAPKVRADRILDLKRSARTVHFEVFECYFAN